MSTLLFSFVLIASSTTPNLSSRVTTTADYALKTHGDAVIETLERLISFKTVHQQGIANKDQASFQAMTAYLKQRSTAMGSGLQRLWRCCGHWLRAIRATARHRHPWRCSTGEPDLMGS